MSYEGHRSSDIPRTPHTVVTSCLLGLLLVGTACATTTTLNGKSPEMQTAENLVERSRMTLDNFLADKAFGPSVRSLLQRAKAVQIYPQVLKAAFIFGGSGGSGVAMARDANNGWSAPAFYTIGGVSFGLQAGGEMNDVLLIALTDRGLAALVPRACSLVSQLMVPSWRHVPV